MRDHHTSVDPGNAFGIDAAGPGISSDSSNPDEVHKVELSITVARRRMPWSHSGGGEQTPPGVSRQTRERRATFLIVPSVFNSIGWAMDDWRGRWCAIIIFGFATLMTLDLPGIPAREWFNMLLDATFGKLRVM